MLGLIVLFVIAVAMLFNRWTAVLVIASGPAYLAAQITPLAGTVVFVALLVVGFIVAVVTMPSATPKP